MLMLISFIKNDVNQHEKKLIDKSGEIEPRSGISCFNHSSRQFG